jgi:predicted RND superfamily exporter protein
MVSNNVPIIILAVGSAYAIHVLNRINQFKGEDPKKTVAKALPLIMIPVILTALTTMIGFLSFIFGAYLSMIRDFGMLAALGTLYSGFLAIVLVPALLAILPNKKKKSKDGVPAKKGKSHLDIYVLLPLYKAVISHPSRVIGVWVLLFLIGIIGIFMLKRSVSVSEYFKSDHPVTVSDEIVEEKFGGSKPIFVVYKGDMLSPELLKSMHDVQEYMKASPYITNAQSISDIVINLNKALSGEEKVPEVKEKIQQLWFLIGQNENISQLVTEDLDQGIIVAKFNNKGQSEVENFDKYLKDYLLENESENFTVEVTGMPYVTVQMDKSLVRSQVASLIIAVILVITVISLMFRSLREGIYASLPILATIAVLYGFMGYTGIPLNIATVLVASVAMGIGIDYSIHFISHFNHGYKKYQSINEALKETMLVSGKAIFVNFISVAAGFSVLVFSDLIPMMYFGILIALSMFGSSMGALTLLPATILMGKKENNSLK